VIPVVFRTPRSLCALNVCAVGFAIAAMTTAAFMLSGPSRHWGWPVIVGIPTVIAGSLWAALLRRRETVGKNTPVGWVLSIPLAAFNGGLACALLCASTGTPQPAAFVGGVVLGMTFGAIIWVPALAVVLLLFGLPLAWARRLAARGLAGEERGEIVIGITCAIFAAAAIALCALAPNASLDEGSLLFHALAVLAAACGIAAAFIARDREARRRRFVARVEADEVPGLRVETRDEGKMLLRVQPHLDTYRRPPQTDQELYALDDEGRALRALQ